MGWVPAAEVGRAETGNADVVAARPSPDTKPWDTSGDADASW